MSSFFFCYKKARIVLICLVSLHHISELNVFPFVVNTVEDYTVLFYPDQIIFNHSPSVFSILRPLSVICIVIVGNNTIFSKVLVTQLSITFLIRLEEIAMIFDVFVALKSNQIFIGYLFLNIPLALCFVMLNFKLIGIFQASCSYHFAIKLDSVSITQNLHIVKLFHVIH